MQIKTEIVINAPKERVYEILTNLSAYEKWNPFIVHSSGKAEKGQIIHNTMMNGKKKMKFSPKVLKTEPHAAFEWLGSLWFGGIFDGHHYFHIEEISEQQVNLIHGESFKGILAPYILKKIGAQTRENFVAMNNALKAYAEKP